MRSPTFIAFALSLAACSDDTGGTDTSADTAADTSADTAADSVDDTAADSADDTTPDTASDSTADSAADAIDETAADSAADSADDTTSDTAVDSADSADTADTSACEYLDEPRVIQCGQALKQISYWVDFAHPDTCAPYYTRDDHRYDTFTALATGEGCDPTCEYIARQAVDFIRCDGAGRSGYESFSADGEGCLEQVYRTADGIFSDLCFWAVYNCYCGEP